MVDPEDLTGQIFSRTRGPSAPADQPGSPAESRHRLETLLGGGVIVERDLVIRRCPELERHAVQAARDCPLPSTLLALVVVRTHRARV